MDSSWRVALKGIFNSNKKVQKTKVAGDSSRAPAQSKHTNNESIPIISNGKIFDNNTISAASGQKHYDSIDQNVKKEAWA